jgi:hypothetical protein
VIERVVHRSRFRTALVLIEISLQLLLGFVSVQQKFLARAERQSANIAIGCAGSGSNEAHDPEGSVGHDHIMAGVESSVK